MKTEEYLDNEGNPIEKTWANYFDQRNKDYCCETCEFTSFKLKEREQQKKILFSYVFDGSDEH